MLPFSWFKCPNLQSRKSDFYFLLNLLERCSHRSHSPWIEGWSPSPNHRMSHCHPKQYTPSWIFFLYSFSSHSSQAMTHLRGNLPLLTGLITLIEFKCRRNFLGSLPIVEVMASLHSSIFDEFMKLLHKEWEVFFILWFFFFIFFLHWWRGFKCYTSFLFVDFFILI